MAMTFNRRVVSIALLGAAMAAMGSANAQKRYDPGASDTEVKIGARLEFIWVCQL
jgi:hypothetical protein